MYICIQYRKLSIKIFKILAVNLPRVNTILPFSTAKLQTSVKFMGYRAKVIKSASKSLRYPHNFHHFHLYTEPRRNLYMQNTVYDCPSALTERVL